MLPAHDAVRSLLALMLLHHARRDARLDADGVLVLLPDQDRDLWHHDEIAEATALLDTPGPDATGSSTAAARRYRLQALIASEHATARTPAETDWRSIAERYEELEALTASPVVRLNRAVAVAETEGADAGLALLDGLDERLGRHHRLHAARAELHARSGRREEALAAFDRALELVGNDAERHWLRARRAEVARR